MSEDKELYEALSADVSVLNDLKDDQIINIFKFLWLNAKASSYSDPKNHKAEPLFAAVTFFKALKPELQNRIFAELLLLDETGRLDDLSTYKKQEINILNYKEQIKTKHFIVKMFFGVIMFIGAFYIVSFRLETLIFIKETVVPILTLDPEAWVELWNWGMINSKDLKK